MTEARYLSSAEAAQLLDVSVTTVKRWVDDGVLPAHKTPGGHRKILRHELHELLRAGRLPSASAPEPPATVGSVPGAPADLAGPLYDALLADDPGRVRALIETAATGSIATLADRVISPAMARVGQAWEEGRIDVYREHRCSQLCLHAVHRLRPALEQRPRPDAPLALGGCPEGDHYQLASLLAELVVLESGWRAVNLGPNTPMPEFRRAVGAYRPRLVWLSVSYLPQPDEFLAAYQPLYAACEERNIAVAVGGRALPEAVRSRMAYTTFGDGLSHLAAFVRSLGPRPVD